MSETQTLPAEEQVQGDLVQDLQPGTQASELPEQCPECARRFKNKQGLARHRSITHGVAGTSRRSKQRSTTSENGQPGRRARSRRSVRATARRGELDVEKLFNFIAPDDSMMVPASLMLRYSRWIDEGRAIMAETEALASQ